MTEKQIKQIEGQLSHGERIDRMYTAFEGGIRVISKNTDGCEIRYNVSFDADGGLLFYPGGCGTCAETKEIQTHTV